METLIEIAKTNIAILVFALAYRLLFARNYFLVARRAYLICSLITAALINFLPSPLSKITVPYIIESTGVETVGWQIDSSAYSSSNIVLISLASLWAIGAAIMTLRLLMALYTVMRYRLSATKKTAFGISYFEIEQSTMAFTIFNWIFVARSTPISKEVLLHERAHLTSLHYMDTLFIELFTIVFWFNPAVWYFKRVARENMECMADRAVIENGIDSKTYQYSLVKSHCTRAQNMVASYFNSSQIKSRIIMINNVNKKRQTLLKYAVLPLIVFAFSFTSARGVIVAETIDSQRAAGHSENHNAKATDFGGFSPLYIVDGVEATEEEVSAISVEDISEISVIKDDSAIEAYGERAKDGVIVYTLKTKGEF